MKVIYARSGALFRGIVHLGPQLADNLHIIDSGILAQTSGYHMSCRLLESICRASSTPEEDVCCERQSFLPYARRAGPPEWSRSFF